MDSFIAATESTHAYPLYLCLYDRHNNVSGEKFVRNCIHCIEEEEDEEGEYCALQVSAWSDNFHLSCIPFAHSYLSCSRPYGA